MTCINISVKCRWIHFGLGIKPGTKLLGLNDESKATLKQRLSEVKLLIVDELSMVSNFLQLPWVTGKLIFSIFFGKGSMKILLGVQLLHLFKLTELTAVVSQNDKLFIDLLNKVWVSNIDDDIEILLKAKFIHESDENYPKDALLMYAEN